MFIIEGLTDKLEFEARHDSRDNAFWPPMPG